MGDAGEVLVGGGDHRGSVVRVGDTVRRPQHAASPSVHALLRHLERVRFDGSPRYLGIDDDRREILAFLPGEVPIPPQPPDGGWPVVTMPAMESVAELLGRFHAAVATFVPGEDARWQGGAPAEFGGTSIGHNDPVVGNVVFRDGRAVALIDFDFAGPSDPLWDLAIAAQHWVPLADPTDFVGAAPDHDPRRRLRRFVRAYGSIVDDVRLLDAVECYLDRGYVSVTARVDAGEPAFVDYWSAGLGSRLLRAVAWLRLHRTSLLAGVDARNG